MNPIEWPGPKPPVIWQSPLEPDAVFSERETKHNAEVANSLRQVARESERRLGILAEHMGIDLRSKTGFQHFAYELARLLCPKGFEIGFSENRPGPDKFWTFQRYAELYADVEAIKRDKNCNDTAACIALVKRAVKAGQGRYLPRKNSSQEQAVSTLQNRLSEAHALVPRLLSLMWFTWTQNAPNDPVKRERFISDRLIQTFGSPELVRT